MASHGSSLGRLSRVVAERRRAVGSPARLQIRKLLMWPTAQLIVEDTSLLNNQECIISAYHPLIESTILFSEAKFMFQTVLLSSRTAFQE